MIKEKELQKAVVSNKLITHKATDLTIMSYDKNVHKLIIPTDITQDQINDIIVLITFRYHENVLQISGELVEDKIEIILPNEIRSLHGEFYIEIDINLTDNRQITFARYCANVVKSDIDSVDLDDAQEFYFELFDDFVQKVADKSEVVVAEIDAHKQSVSDEADTAIAVITDASNSVTIAKQSALTSIAQATSDVTDASTQFTADLADTQSTIDTQVAQAQDSLQEVSGTLTAVNDKVATVNDTTDSFMADVAEKSQLVDDKYQQFDDNVTTAGQTIDDILGLADDVQQIGVELNKKANKTQEAWITPTLLNGAIADPLYPPEYRKNTIGQIELRGSIRAITAGAPSLQPIAGYKILRASRFSVIDTSGTQRKIYNNATGNFYIDVTTDGTYICLDGLIYVPTEV